MLTIFEPLYLILFLSGMLTLGATPPPIPIFEQDNLGYQLSELNAPCSSEHPYPSPTRRLISFVLLDVLVAAIVGDDTGQEISKEASLGLEATADFIKLSEETQDLRSKQFEIVAAMSDISSVLDKKQTEMSESIVKTLSVYNSTLFSITEEISKANGATVRALDKIYELALASRVEQRAVTVVLEAIIQNSVSTNYLEVALASIQNNFDKASAERELLFSMTGKGERTMKLMMSNPHLFHITTTTTPEVRYTIQKSTDVIHAEACLLIEEGNRVCYPGVGSLFGLRTKRCHFVPSRDFNLALWSFSFSEEMDATKVCYTGSFMKLVTSNILESTYCPNTPMANIFSWSSPGFLNTSLTNWPSSRSETAIVDMLSNIQTCCDQNKFELGSDCMSFNRTYVGTWNGAFIEFVAGAPSLAYPTMTAEPEAISVILGDYDLNMIYSGGLCLANVSSDCNGNMVGCEWGKPNSIILNKSDYPLVFDIPNYQNIGPVENLVKLKETSRALGDLESASAEVHLQVHNLSTELTSYGTTITEVKTAIDYDRSLFSLSLGTAQEDLEDLKEAQRQSEVLLAVEKLRLASLEEKVQMSLDEADDLRAIIQESADNLDEISKRVIDKDVLSGALSELIPGINLGDLNSLALGATGGVCSGPISCMLSTLKDILFMVIGLVIVGALIYVAIQTRCCFIQEISYLVRCCLKPPPGTQSKTDGNEFSPKSKARSRPMLRPRSILLKNPSSFFKEPSRGEYKDQEEELTAVFKGEGSTLVDTTLGEQMKMELLKTKTWKKNEKINISYLRKIGERAEVPPGRYASAVAGMMHLMEDEIIYDTSSETIFKKDSKELLRTGASSVDISENMVDLEDLKQPNPTRFVSFEDDDSDSWSENDYWSPNQFSAQVELASSFNIEEKGKEPQPCVRNLVKEFKEKKKSSKSDIIHERRKISSQATIWGGTLVTFSEPGDCFNKLGRPMKSPGVLNLELVRSKDNFILLHIGGKTSYEEAECLCIFKVFGYPGALRSGPFKEDVILDKIDGMSTKERKIGLIITYQQFRRRSDGLTKSGERVFNALWSVKEDLTPAQLKFILRLKEPEEKEEDGLNGNSEPEQLPKDPLSNKDFKPGNSEEQAQQLKKERIQVGRDEELKREFEKDESEEVGIDPGLNIEEFKTAVQEILKPFDALKELNLPTAKSEQIKTKPREVTGYMPDAVCVAPPPDASCPWDCPPPLISPDSSCDGSFFDSPGIEVKHDPVDLIEPSVPYRLGPKGQIRLTSRGSFLQDKSDWDDNSLSGHSAIPMNYYEDNPPQEIMERLNSSHPCLVTVMGFIEHAIRTDNPEMLSNMLDKLKLSSLKSGSLHGMEEDTPENFLIIFDYCQSLMGRVSWIGRPESLYTTCACGPDSGRGEGATDCLQFLESRLPDECFHTILEDTRRHFKSTYDFEMRPKVAKYLGLSGVWNQSKEMKSFSLLQSPGVDWESLGEERAAVYEEYTEEDRYSHSLSDFLPGSQPSSSSPKASGKEPEEQTCVYYGNEEVCTHKEWCSGDLSSRAGFRNFIKDITRKGLEKGCTSMLRHLNKPRGRPPTQMVFLFTNPNLEPGLVGRVDLPEVHLPTLDIQNYPVLNQEKFISLFSACLSEKSSREMFVGGFNWEYAGTTYCKKLRTMVVWYRTDFVVKKIGKLSEETIAILSHMASKSVIPTELEKTKLLAVIEEFP